MQNLPINVDYQKITKNKNYKRANNKILRIIC